MSDPVTRPREIKTVHGLEWLYLQYCLCLLLRLSFYTQEKCSLFKLKNHVRRQGYNLITRCWRCSNLEAEEIQR
nr:unnamed protein product [Haemonchus contortus]